MTRDNKMPDARIPIISEDVLEHHKRHVAYLREKVALETIGIRIETHEMSPDAFADVINDVRNRGHNEIVAVMCKHDAGLIGFTESGEYLGVKVYIHPTLVADSYIIPLAIYNEMIES